MIKAIDLAKTGVPDDARILVVSGSESYLREQAIEQVMKSWPADLDVRKVSGRSDAEGRALDVREFLDDLRTASLFGGECLIHVCDAEAFVKENAESLERFFREEEFVHRLVLEGESLFGRGAKTDPKTGPIGACVKAGGLIISCDPLFDAPFQGNGPPHQSQLSRWIQEQAAAFGKRMSLEDAYLLHRLAGTGLRELRGEVEKLSVFVGTRKQINADDIDTAVGAGRLAGIFDLADAVVRRDEKSALAQSEVLFDRGFQDYSGRVTRDPATIGISLLAAMASRLRKVGRVLELMAGGELFEDAANAVKHPVFFRDRLRAQVEAWKDQSELQKAMKRIRDLDRELKTGGMTRVEIERFLVTGIRAKVRIPPSTARGARSRM